MTEIVIFDVMKSLDELEGAKLSDQATVRLSRFSRNLSQDCRKLCENLKDWLQVSKSGIPHWKRLSPDWNSFCKTFMQRDAEFVDAMLAGYEVLDKENAIPLKVALEAAKSRGRPEIAAHGGAREGALPHGAGPGRGYKKEETQDSGLSLSLDDKGKPKKVYGNSPSYLADRIRRDCPDVFLALERGKYNSIREAAVAAGLSHLITRKRIEISDDPIKIVAALKRVCSPDVLVIVAALLRDEYGACCGQVVPEDKVGAGAVFTPRRARNTRTSGERS